jgi:hypothetical protein
MTFSAVASIVASMIAVLLCVISLERLAKSFDLQALRRVSRQFQPPQFFSRLKQGRR